MNASPFTGLSSGELAEMRAVQAATLTNTATRVRSVRDGDDGQGGDIEREVRETLLCRPLPMTNQPSDVTEGAAMRSRADIRILFEFGADIRQGDTLEMDGLNYGVVFVDGARADSLETVAYCSAEKGQ